MALTTATNGQEVTCPDINENTFQFKDSVQKRPNSVWWIEVTAGTIRFAADEAIVDATHRAWPVGSKIPMTVNKTLHYKGASITDKFVVTV